jgi:hypothetical protein
MHAHTPKARQAASSLSFSIEPDTFGEGTQNDEREWAEMSKREPGGSSLFAFPGGHTRSKRLREGEKMFNQTEKAPGEPCPKPMLKDIL